MEVIFSSPGDISREEAEKKLGELMGRAIEELEDGMPALKSWGKIWNGENIPGPAIYSLISAAAFSLTVCLIGKSLFKLSGKLKMYPSIMITTLQSFRGILRSLRLQERKPQDIFQAGYMFQIRS